MRGPQTGTPGEEPTAPGAEPAGEVRWERPDTGALDLAGVMAYLRARCPWAAAHTHASLQRYLLEEAYELLAALDGGDAEEIEGELGDVLYQVIFHAALLDESRGLAQGETLHRVAGRLKGKLIRRHPHVFDSDGPVELAEVERRYEAIKAQERAERAAATGGTADTGAEAGGRGTALADSFASVPVSLPALTRAQAVLDRCQRLSVPAVDPGTSPTGAPAASAVAPPPGTGDTPEDFGAELFALVRRAGAAGVDAEAALRAHTARVEAASVAGAGPVGEGAGGNGAGVH
ncbi:nucleoside triphosphate pyrophosphohydrolase [Brevibacterium sp. 50QC2O2]|uniref:MazG nucleotide pyrophosphohydrolase domain-containing protein n=1 Tax=Brevibacterium sp. 50QC2O2 TaxID=2968459 RepID=UPI00211BAADE|nr:nucleoside triphosphate pyrophosphohydrolase [Brevibacterium sp. 50QC2O2]